MNHEFTAWLVFMGFIMFGAWLMPNDSANYLSAVGGGIAVTVVGLLFEISGKMSKLLQSLKERRD